jgi:hypothetical protein
MHSSGCSHRHDASCPNPLQGAGHARGDRSLQVVRASACQPKEVSDPIASACLVPSDAGMPAFIRLQRRQSLSAAISMMITEMLDPADFGCNHCQVTIRRAKHAVP